MSWFIIVLTVFLALLLYDQLYYRKEKTVKIPGPLRYPLAGNGDIFIQESKKFLQTIGTLVTQYGGMFRIFCCSELFVVISDPEKFEEVMPSTEVITKSDIYKYLHPWLGQGLLTSTGQLWKSHRKFLTPAFHFNILQSFLPIFLKNDEIFIKKLRPYADGKSIDIFPIVASLALDNVSESAMGVSVKALQDSESEYVKAVNDISTIIYMRMRHPIYRYDIFYNLSSYGKKQEKALSILHGFTNNVIKSRRMALEGSKTTLQNYDDDSGIKKKCGFLDLLLLSEVDGKNLSDESIREEVDTFMFEGHDTTTSAICFTLYCISNNSEVQEKVVKEQRNIFGNDFNRHPTYSDLNEMKYLEMVIKESLRLYPSVPMIGRTVTKDTDMCGTTIPTGTNIIINIFHMQRQASVFDEPLAFRPERFTSEEIKKRNNFSWISFSAGPRNCIGQKFAMVEMKAVLSSVIRHYQLQPSGVEPILCGDLILKSQNGVHVKFLPRTEI